MSTLPYDDLLKQVRELPVAQQRLLVDALQGALEETPRSGTRLIDLQGLGKDAWAGLNTDEYLDEERNAWDR